MRKSTPLGYTATAALAVALVGLSTPFQAQTATASGVIESDAQTHALTLKLIPQWDASMEADLQAKRKAVAAGDKPKSYVTESPIKGRGTLKENHLFVEVGDDNEISLSITGPKGELKPMASHGDLIADLMKDYLRCHNHGAKSHLPLSFYTSIQDAPSGVLTGGYKVKCTPGTAQQRAKLTVADEIEGMRLSTEIPVNLRKASIFGLKGRELREKYIIGKNLSDEEKSATWERITAESKAWLPTVDFPQ